MRVCPIVLIFTVQVQVRRYASMVYAVVVCPSVCLSQAGTVPKWLNTGSRKQLHTIAHGLQFSGTKDLCEISTATEVPNRGGVGSNQRFSTNILLHLKNGAS